MAVVPETKAEDKAAGARRTLVSLSAQEKVDAATLAGTECELERASVHLVYERIALDFDRTRHSPWPRVSVELARAKKGSLVCDVGCGNGKYLRSAPPGLAVIGLDFCASLVKLANKVVNPLCGVSAIRGDAMLVPMRANAFDVVLCIAVLHHFASPDRRIAALREILRLLKPDGRALITVWAFEQLENARRRFPSQDVMVPWTLKSNEKEDPNGTVELRYYHVFRCGELEELIAKAGGVVLESGFEHQNHFAVITKQS